MTLFVGRFPSSNRSVVPIEDLLCTDPAGIKESPFARLLLQVRLYLSRALRD